MDVAPTILYAMGIPVPDDMDGRVLTDIFSDAFLSERPLRERKAGGGARKREGISPTEEEKIISQLRGLGYL